MAADEGINEIYQLMETKNYWAAIRKLMGLLEKEPNFAKGLSLLGICYFETTRYSEAISCFDKAIAAAPNDYFAYGEKAKCLLLKREFDIAIANFTKAYELAPEEKEEEKVDFLVSIGYIHLVRGDEKTANEWLEKAFELDPERMAFTMQEIFEKVYAPDEKLSAEDKLALQEDLNKLQERAKAVVEALKKKKGEAAA